MRHALGGVALALSWLTVAPVRGPHEVDRAVAARAIRAAPVAGLVLGGAATAVAWVVSTAGGNAGIIGFACVGFLALATRGMHIDGLADTADGLGCYGPPERAREVMKSGGAGPFGVAALIVVLALQAAAFGALAGADSWAAIGFAVAFGRVTVVPACRRGLHAAEGSRFGALVADSQGPVAIGAWSLIAMAAAAVCMPGPLWLGPVAVGAALALSWWFVRHCATRFGGVGGDILGATTEGCVALLAVVAACAV
ncbi:adenosylcobinamide-GDP ribazoletransferase [Rhodococcus artemisiae]|uniref:Adenosylcobinamide-GDP ribazoletransferase n=1 Tax=Rhodococcus artemisiae TaxID=714159 RepID=A0ABU7L8H7_9NOCA|nr:adenosylcobinamide-GDP ribazoletransferase [Rhodococcus artemisiae]MEE2057849.1 adenosylcobinamide-GDP ribazoletransferase [Rhodococcus artemisiae]